MDYTALLSGSGGGGGGGYGGDISSKVASGGTNKAAFGSVNFGAGAKVGGTSTAEGDAGTGLGNITLLYFALGIVALLAVYLFARR